MSQSNLFRLSWNGGIANTDLQAKASHGYPPGRLDALHLFRAPPLFLRQSSSGAPFPLYSLLCSSPKAPSMTLPHPKAPIFSPTTVRDTIRLPSALPWVSAEPSTTASRWASPTRQIGAHRWPHSGKPSRGAPPLDRLPRRSGWLVAHAFTSVGRGHLDISHFFFFGYSSLHLCTLCFWATR